MAKCLWQVLILATWTYAWTWPCKLTFSCSFMHLLIATARASTTLQAAAKTTDNAASIGLYFVQFEVMWLHSSTLHSLKRRILHLHSALPEDSIMTSHQHITHSTHMAIPLSTHAPRDSSTNTEQPPTLMESSGSQAALTFVHIYTSISSHLSRTHATKGHRLNNGI
jgi:hypothetical protein